MLTGLSERFFALVSGRLRHGLVDGPISEARAPRSVRAHLSVSFPILEREARLDHGLRKEEDQVESDLPRAERLTQLLSDLIDLSIQIVLFLQM